MARRSAKEKLAELTRQRCDFCVTLANIKHEAGRLGLFKTMHALDEATKAVGWEVAELMEKDGRP